MVGTRVRQTHGFRPGCGRLRDHAARERPYLRKGASRPFIGPHDFLSRTDRAWLRAQVADGQSVPDARHAVVVAAARQMVGEAIFPPPDLGLALSFIGMSIASPYAGIVAPFSVFAAWVLVRAVRAAVWSRRARRWLAFHA